MSKVQVRPRACKQWARQLATLHTLDLVQSERVALHEHLRGCQGCREVYAEYQQMDQQIMALPDVQPLKSLAVPLGEVEERQQASPVSIVHKQGKVGAIKKGKVGATKQGQGRPVPGRMVGWLNGLAAVLVVGVVISSALALFALYNDSRFANVISGGTVPGGPGMAVYTSNTEDGTIYALNPKEGTVYWRSMLYTKLVSNPTVQNGIVFAGAYNGYLYALRVRDGALLWKHKFPIVRLIHLLQPNAPAPRMMADGKLVFVTSDGGLHALKISDGSEVWRQPAATACDINKGSETCERVLVGLHNGIVYAYLNGLYAFRASDGKELWHNARLNTGPGVFNLIDGKIYLDTYEQSSLVYVLDARSGTQIQTIAVGPLVTGGGKETFLVMTQDGYGLKAVRISDNKVIWEKLFKERGAYVLAVDKVHVYVQARSCADGVTPDDVQGAKEQQVKIEATANAEFSSFETARAQGKNPTPPYSTRPSDTLGICALSITDGRVVWSLQEKGVYLWLESVAGDTLYVASGNGVEARRVRDGSLIWHALQGRLEAPVVEQE